jgi:N-acetylmuramoyl-L-alanine amidase
MSRSTWQAAGQVHQRGVYPDVKVVYTREDDRFIELMERCNIANRAKADVFISIHCNANDSKDPHGCETYVMGLHKTEANMRWPEGERGHPIGGRPRAEVRWLRPEGPGEHDRPELAPEHPPGPQPAAQLIDPEAVQGARGPRDRGVKQAGFLVISYTTMPSVLIELGFLTNAGRKRTSCRAPKGQDYMASAIYRAFKEYKNHIEGTRTCG